MIVRTVLTIAVIVLWVGPAIWVYRDARRAGRPAAFITIAVLVIPYVALGVYIATRAVFRHPIGDLSTNGEGLLREMTKEIERLRARVAELESTLAGAKSTHDAP